MWRSIPALALALALVLAAAGAAAQVPAGGEFQVNTYTTDDQAWPRISLNAAGDFVVVWQSRLQDGAGSSVRGQRFRVDGARVGSEFRADGGTSAVHPAVALDQSGRAAVLWAELEGQGSEFQLRSRRFGAQGGPLGAEFGVNATSGSRDTLNVGPLPRGGFVVAWQQYDLEALPNSVRARRFGGFGVPRGGDLVVNAATTHVSTDLPAVAAGDDGRFVVTWQRSYGLFPPTLFGQLFDANGVPTGGEFQVVSNVSGDVHASAAMAGDGSFVVAWLSYPLFRIEAQRFSPAGERLSAQMHIAPQQGVTRYRSPFVAGDRRGNFVVVWTREDMGQDDVIGRRFGADGSARGGEFRVNASGTSLRYATGLASDDVGNFVVTWMSLGQDGSGLGAFAQRFGGLTPAGMAVDTAPSAGSDGNGVLEPGETVDVRPSWRNVSGAAQAFTAVLPLFGGPPAQYTITDGAGGYGTVGDGSTGPCLDCFEVRVSAPSPRPLLHWDGLLDEDLAPDSQGQRKRWRVHVGESFTDVPRANGYYRFVETLLHNLVTGGCSATQYCPQSATTREQMAVFVLVAREHSGDAPPACAAPLFSDVPASSVYCPWIVELARSGVVSGCGGGNFCPHDAVSREHMAVFTLRTLDGTLDPPACTTPLFSDVPASSPYCRWIEELARRGIVGGCGGGRFCPTDAVTREQMAVFISGTFSLKLYGPLP